MCSPPIRIVTQLTIARIHATPPSRPVSPVSDVLSLPPPLTARPRPTPPTRIRCGIARITLNAVVRRLRFVSCGTIEIETGYATATVCHTSNRGTRGDRGETLSVRAQYSPRFPSSSRRLRIRHRSRRRLPAGFEISDDRQRSAADVEDVSPPVHPLLVVEVQLRPVPVPARFQGVDVARGRRHR